jgi:hypothetical protein
MPRLRTRRTSRLWHNDGSAEVSQGNDAELGGKAKAATRRNRNGIDREGNGKSLKHMADRKLEQTIRQF